MAAWLLLALGMHDEDLYAECDVVYRWMRHGRQDVRFRKIGNSDKWIDSVQALAEDREVWSELCSGTAHLGEAAVQSKRHKSRAQLRCICARNSAVEAADGTELAPSQNAAVAGASQGFILHLHSTEAPREKPRMQLRTLFMWF
ncbi:hypothetical protein RB195_019583 [Necator americanus]|uniref:Uncharacterized protein n=1 Tax=Necator americanus TaxID=51031 RepID=A0ABR1CEX2_NECAM